MNRNTILTIGVLGVLAYLVFGRKKSPAKEIGQAPATPSGKPVSGVDKGTVAETTATLKAKGVRVPKRKLITTADIKVSPKTPLYVAPTNLIPDQYDRGIGLPVVAANGGQSYYNVSGICSEDMQKACKCGESQSKSAKLDIPSLP